MEPEELFDQVEKVNSRETFLAFLQSLERDFELSREQERKALNLSEPAARGWYSASISDFLGAMRAWAPIKRPGAYSLRCSTTASSMNSPPNTALQRTPPASPLAPLSFQTLGSYECDRWLSNPAKRWKGLAHERTN
jgi:hypothetical protein